MSNGNRMAPSALPGRFLTIAAAALLASCGSGGGGSGGGSPIEQQTITGRVIDGYLASALVCLDQNANARCDGGEPQALTDATGAYALAIPQGSASPLVAEAAPGRSRDLGPPAATVDAAFRMVSPGTGYGTTITPFTTLVWLTGERDYALAEDLVRNEVGLPPRYPIAGDYVASGDALAQSVARGVVVALKAVDATVDLAAPGALARVVAAFPPAIAALPQIRIETKDAAPILDRENYVDATFTISDPAAGGATFALNGKIRGRGHSTWGYPKNPYKVQFANDAAYAAVPQFLGMKRQRNWALLADYFDRSLIRNKLAFSLGGSVAFRDGLKWTPSVQHVEAWLNGEYIGVYLLAEDIRIDPNRLPIRAMSKSVGAGEVDGGYIVEVDVRQDCYDGADFSLKHTTPRGVKVCQSRPDEGDITMPQLAWIKAYLDATEGDVYAGRLDGIHLPSFVDYVLLHELLRVDDAQFLTSVFMWKDSASAAIASDRLLNMGPMWDYDRSVGNNQLHDHWQTTGCWVVKPFNPNWFASLAADPRFVTMAVDRWKAKRDAVLRFVDASTDTFARRIEAAQQRNFAKWPILGAPMTNYYTFATWQEEVAFVRRFLDERVAWMDRAFASPEAFATMCR